MPYKVGDKVVDILSRYGIIIRIFGEHKEFYVVLRGENGNIFYTNKEKIRKITEIEFAHYTQLVENKIDV